MTFRGQEKMDEGPETTDNFVVPSPPIHDSKPSSIIANVSKHGHQSTSTPYVGAFETYDCTNLKRNHDSCGNPTFDYDTPISKAPDATAYWKYCGHQSFDVPIDAEPHPDEETHPQLNLLSCFEEKHEAKEFPSVRADFGGSSVWPDRLPKQKRRSLQMEKSPSPHRSKRLSLDLSSDSGCFSTHTTQSDSHFSGELTHLPSVFPATEETGGSTFPGRVCLPEQLSARSIPSFISANASDEKCFSGRQTSETLHSNLTPSVGEKLPKLQLALTYYDSGCSVTSMDMSCEPTRNVRSNFTPSFGDKPFKLQPVLPSDVGCSVTSTVTSDKSASDIRSKSTLSFNERVSKLESSDVGRNVNTTDLGSSTQSIRSESTHAFGDVFNSQCFVTNDPHCNFTSMNVSHQSDLFLAKSVSRKQDIATGGEKTSLETRHESEVIRNIPQTVERSSKETFAERFAEWKTKLDREIGLRIGKRYVDIIKELGRKLFMEPLAKIFDYLSEEDLCSVCLVSRQWKSAVELETSARLRRRKYIQDNRQRIAATPQENRTKLVNLGRSGLSFTNSNKPMTEIQTMEELPISRPTVATTLTKSEEFFREARSLDPRTESLRKCPKCNSPARANEKERHARCTKCRYEFCVFCRKLLHAGSECVTYVRNPAPAKIGSKQSKHNLRRL